MAIQLKEINSSNIADWPIWFKGLSIFLVFIICSFAGFWFYAKNTLDQLSQLEKREIQLKASVVLKMKQAASLPQYKNQMEELKKVYASMVKQLPNSKEVPQLVDDITSVGVRSGLVFRLIRPMPEKAETFYATLPIQMSVVGDYNELGEFIGGIAALPRIVLIHDFTIRPLNVAGDKGPSSGKLSMTIKASTYRYLSAEEQKNNLQKVGGRKNG